MGGKGSPRKVVKVVRGTQDAEEKRRAMVILLLFSACFYSLIQTGRGWAHHLIKLVPFMALGSGYFIHYFISRSKKKYRVLLPLILLTVTLWPILGQYKILFIQLHKGQGLQSDTGYKLARYLSQNNVSGKFIFLTDYHIVYWLTGAQIPTKYAHPTDLMKSFLMRALDGESSTPEQELKNILARNPVFIIKQEHYLSVKKNNLDDILDSEINALYRLDSKINEMYLYKKIESTV